MHRLGLVHNDLKLINVFVTSNEEYPDIKIGDLGYTYRHIEGQNFAKKRGTLAFMSPETVLG